MNRLSMNVIYTILIVVLITACTLGQNNQESQGGLNADGSNEGFEFTESNYPRMGGSLANLPLGEAVTAAVLGIDREKASEMIAFESSTTSNYNSLVDGRFDILIAYEPSQEALDYADGAGFKWEMTPIGRDALVFIANRQNTVNDLSLAQIKGIYTGDIKNWQEVGGREAEIIPYQRNSSSGSQTLFDKLVMPPEKTVDPPYQYTIGTMGGLLEVVAAYDNSSDALGYTVYYYLTNMEQAKLKDIKILSLDGIAPNNDTIASGQYSLTNDFYVVIPANIPFDHPARVLRNWILSAEGKELARREDYVVIE